MSKLKHTPGPWNAWPHDGGFEITMGTANPDEDGVFPLELETQHRLVYAKHLGHNSREQYEEAEANARLIAAAPGLLDAVAEALDEDSGIPANSELRKLLGDAFTKATGQLVGEAFEEECEGAAA